MIATTKTPANPPKITLHWYVTTSDPAVLPQVLEWAERAKAKP